MASDFDVEQRIQGLLEKRGAELISGIVEELKRAHKERAALTRELAALSDYQASKDIWLKLDAAQKPPAELPRLIAVHADQYLDPRNGFYGVEYDDKGVPFCWTGPSRKFSFEVFVDRTHGADLVLEAFRCVDFETQHLTLFVDGETVPIEKQQAAPGVRFLATLPISERGTSTSLVFMMSQQLTPSGGEQRLLGMSFTRLQIKAKKKEEGAKVIQMAPAPLAILSSSQDFPAPNAKKRKSARSENGFGDEFHAVSNLDS